MLTIHDLKIDNPVHFYLNAADKKNGKPTEGIVIGIAGCYSNAVILQFANPNAKQAANHPLKTVTVHVSNVEGIRITKEYLFDKFTSNAQIADNENFIVIRFGYKHGYAYFSINPDNGVTYIQIHTNGDEIKLRREIKYIHEFKNLVYEITKEII